MQNLHCVTNEPERPPSEAQDSAEWRLVTTIATEMVKESGHLPVRLEDGVLPMLGRPQLLVLVPSAGVDKASARADLARWKQRVLAGELPGVKRVHLLYCLATADHSSKLGRMRDVSFLNKGAACDVVDISGRSKVSATLNRTTRSAIARGIQRYDKGTPASMWELRQEAERQKSVQGAFRTRLAQTRPWGTYLIFAFCVLMFLWASALGGSENLFVQLRLGANYAPLTLDQGQGWRLLSSTFLHLGIFHLALNMLALLVVGPNLERIYGNSFFLGLYGLCGLSGSLCSALYDSIVSVGASGALFGVFGAALVLSWRYRKEWPVGFRHRVGAGMLPMIVYNLLYGYFADGVDNAAHLGGLAAGVVFGLLVRPEVLSVTRAPRRRTVLRRAAWLVGLAPFLIQGLALEHGMRVASLSDYPSAVYRNPWSSVSFTLPALFEPGRLGGQDYFEGPGLVVALVEMEEPDLVFITNPWFQHELKQAEGHRSLSTLKVDGRTWLLQESFTEMALFQAYGYIGEKPLKVEVAVTSDSPEVGSRLIRDIIASLSLKGFSRQAAARRLARQGLAMRVLEELDGEGEEDGLQVERALAYIALNEHEKAGALLDELRKKDPKNPRYLDLERFRRRGSGDASGALALTETLRAQSTSAEQKEFNDMSRAALLLILRRDQEAEAILNGFLARDDKDVKSNAYNLWAWELVSRGEYDKALPLAEKSVALSRNRNNLDTLATAQYGLGLYDEAYATFDETLGLDLNLGNSNFYTAKLLERDGEKRQAVLFYHRYLLLDGKDSPHAEEARRALVEMGEGPLR